MEFVRRLRSDLVDAMKENDPVRVRVIRTLLAGISNAESVAAGPAVGAPGLYSGEAERRLLDRDDLRAVVEAELSELDEAGEKLGATDRYDEMMEERRLVAGYLETL